MENNFYVRRRAELVKEINEIEKFFPRCRMDRIRKLAKLDAEHTGDNYDDCLNDAYEKFNNETSKTQILWNKTQK